MSSGLKALGLQTSYIEVDMLYRYVVKSIFSESNSIDIAETFIKTLSTNVCNNMHEVVDSNASCDATS